MRYKIVKSATAEGLTKGVNEMLASGWKCQGGVSTNVEGAYSESLFVQAMVK